jgi:hypothetical protein
MQTPTCSIADVFAAHPAASAALAGLYEVIELLQSEQHNTHAFDQSLIDLALAGRRLLTVLSSLARAEDQTPHAAGPA